MNKCEDCKGTGKIKVGSIEEPDAIICPLCNGKGERKVSPPDHLINIIQEKNK